MICPFPYGFPMGFSRGFSYGVPPRSETTLESKAKTRLEWQSAGKWFVFRCYHMSCNIVDMFYVFFIFSLIFAQWFAKLMRVPLLGYPAMMNDLPSGVIKHGVLERYTIYR